MQQEDGVVQRHRQLQDGRDGERDVGHLAQKDVRTHVEQHRHTDSQQEEHRLDPRGGGEHEYQKDERHQDGERVGHLAAGHGLGLGRVHGLAGCAAVFAHDVVDGLERLGLLASGHRHVEQRMAVAVVLSHSVRIQHLKRRAQVNHIVQPQNALDAGRVRQLLLVREGLLRIHAAHHNARVGHGSVEFGVHLLERPRGLRRLGQIGRQVVVDGHEQRRNSRQQGEHQRHPHDGAAMIRDERAEPLH